jgi:hypothetical protein
MLSVPWVVIVVVVVIGVHTVAVAATSVHGRDAMTMVDASVDRIPVGSVADNQDLPLRRCLAPTDTIDYGGDDTPYSHLHHATTEYENVTDQSDDWSIEYRAFSEIVYK